MASGIYRIDLGNENFYIGSAVNLKRRENEHRSDLECGVHCNRFVQRCWNKHQIFVFTILEKCAPDDLIMREQFFLDQHFDEPKNVNLCQTAGSCLGIKRSNETKAKMAAARKGKTLSAEHRANISAAWKFRAPASAETRAKQSAALKAYYARKREAA